jgi:hypothetical protein
VNDIYLGDSQLRVRALGKGSAAVLSSRAGTYDVMSDGSALDSRGLTATETLLNNNCAFTANFAEEARDDVYYRRPRPRSRGTWCS